MKIAVIGLGAIGSQALLHLAQMDGVKASGFERYSPGHGFGASGGENRLFSRVSSEYTNYTELVDYGLQVWENLERRGGQQILKRVGYLSVSEEHKTEDNSIFQGARLGESSTRILNQTEMEAEFGFQNYQSGDVGVFDPTGGMIRTDAAIHQAVNAAEALGAVIHRHSKVEMLTTTSTQAHVQVGSTVHAFDLVVLTTGPWVHQFLPELSGQVHVYRPTSAWFLPKHTTATLRGIPALARDGKQQFYAAPTFDGASLKVGYGGPRQRSISDGPKPEDMVVNPDELGEFPTILEDYLTGFESMPYRIAHYFEGYTDSTRPVIQRMNEHVITGVGFSGLGFKLSPIFGRLLAEEAAGRVSAPVRSLAAQIPQLTV